MKREILFRGKGVHSEEWVYGDLIHGVGERHGMISILPITKNLAKIPYCDPLDGVYVNPETVGQFMGLTDKNGVKIFEGDILKTATGKPMIVGWSYKFASFVLNRNGWAFSHWFGESCNPEDCEVIGNIHDNPELMK